MSNRLACRRRWQFTLRHVVIVITATAVTLALTPAVWNARFTAPGRIPVMENGNLELPMSVVYFPIERDTARAYYLLDGGTYGVEFVDARGVHHKIFSWQSLSAPEHQGDIIIEGCTPSDGGTNVGKLPIAECLIFSVMETIDWSKSDSYPTTMQAIYPTCGETVVRRLIEMRLLSPELAFDLGLL